MHNKRVFSNTVKPIKKIKIEETVDKEDKIKPYKIIASYQPNPDYQVFVYDESLEIDEDPESEEELDTESQPEEFNCTLLDISKLDKHYKTIILIDRLSLKASIYKSSTFESFDHCALQIVDEKVLSSQADINFMKNNATQIEAGYILHINSDINNKKRE